MAKDGRSGERDPLGKQLMQFGDPDWVTLAGCAAAAVAGLMGVAVGAVLGFKIIVMAVSAVVQAVCTADVAPAHTTRALRAAWDDGY